jgi:membrane fusion protein (multidrug efflux system)
MHRTRDSILPLLLTGIILLGCGPGGQEDDVREEVIVQITRPMPGEIEDVLHFIGELRAEKEARLDFNYSGRIAAFNYEVGEPVKKGAVMARLRQEEIRAQLEQAEAAHQKARSDLERVERLHAQEIVSDDRLESARVGTKAARAALVMAQEALKNSAVIAPFSGSVAEKNGEVGEYYNAMMGGPSVYRLVKIDTVEAVIGVPESEVPRVSVGQEARLSVETYPDRMFQGTVTRVGLDIDRYSRTLEAEISAANPEGLLKPGMLADIELVVDRRHGVLSLPQKAVIRDMGLEHVFVIEDSLAVKREVVSGATQDGRIEIREGLQADDQVVIEGQFGLKEGDRVSFTAAGS